MKTIPEKINLEAKIIALRNKQADDLLLLKEQYHDALDRFTPLQLLKSATLDLISSPNLKSTLVIGTIGLGVNYFSKNLLIQTVANPIKKVIAKVLKSGLPFLLKKNE